MNEINNPFPKFSEIHNALQNLYKKIPSIDCSGCDGRCCVSPTMTAPEFVEMIRGARLHFSNDKFKAILSELPIEHKKWEGTAICRFQDKNTGLCLNYDPRALGCRLHGHDALRMYETEDMVFCDLKPHGYKVLQTETVQNMAEVLSNLLKKLNIEYAPPYYIAGLNLESWIDLATHPELFKDRPSLQNLREFLSTYLDLSQNMGQPFLTTIKGKLNSIDRLNLLLEQGDGFGAEELLNSLIHDYPSTGTFFIEEAKTLLKMLQEKLKELSEK